SLPQEAGLTYYGFAPRGDFTDQFSFSLATDAVVSGTFFKFLVNKVDLSFKALADDTWTAISRNQANPVVATFTLGAGALSSGDYLLRISGTGVSPLGGRFYGGQLAVAPVPEPETWAMLTVGSLLVGYQLRRKQKAL